MYLAPFIGIGLGWLLHLVFEAIFILITKYIHNREDKEVKGERGKSKGSLRVKKNIAKNYLLMTFRALGWVGGRVGGWVGPWHPLKAGRESGATDSSVHEPQPPNQCAHRLPV